jgi:membrane protein DedA with SNARE-associated domain
VPYVTSICNISYNPPKALYVDKNEDIAKTIPMSGNTNAITDTTMLARKYFRIFSFEYTKRMSSEVILQLLIQYKYVLIIPTAWVLGPVISLMGGFLLRIGSFDFLPLYLSIMGAELLGDIMWYWIGYKYGNSFIHTFGSYFSITEEKVMHVRNLFNRHHDIILIISKLTMGFGFAPAVLFTAGLSRVSFRRYITINIVGQFFWTGGLIALGYYTGYLYFGVENIFARMSLIAFLVILVAGFIGLGRYLHKRRAHTP